MPRVKLSLAPQFHYLILWPPTTRRHVALWDCDTWQNRLHKKRAPNGGLQIYPSSVEFTSVRNINTKQLKVVNDKSYSRSWAKGYGCYEQLSIMDDMNDSRSCEVKPIDAKYNSKLWMIWICVLRELKVMDDMNDSRLWVQSCEWYERLRILWAQASRCYEQLRVEDNMNDSWF